MAAAVQQQQQWANGQALRGTYAYSTLGLPVRALCEAIYYEEKAGKTELGFCPSTWYQTGPCLQPVLGEGERERGGWCTQKLCIHIRQANLHPTSYLYSVECWRKKKKTMRKLQYY